MGNLDILWVSGYVGYLILAAVIIVRRRYTVFRWFSALLAFDILHSSALAYFNHTGNEAAYGLVYFVGELIETGLRVGVMLELTRIASKHTGHSEGSNLRWVRNALIAAGIVTSVMVWHMHGLHSLVSSVVMKVSFGSAIVGWFLVITLFFITFFGGVRIRAHSQAVTLGLVVYFTSRVLTGVILLMGESGMWVTAQDKLQPVYVVCLYAWSIALWFDEPKRLLTPEMEGMKKLMSLTSAAAKMGTR